MESTEKSLLSRVLRVAFLAFLLLTCVRVWTGPGNWEPTALAQIPDAGLQRKQAIDEARRTNQLLQEIRAILSDGVLNVRIQGADNPAGAPPAMQRPDH